MKKGGCSAGNGTAAASTMKTERKRMRAVVKMRGGARGETVGVVGDDMFSF